MSLSGLQQTGYNEATEGTVFVDSGAIYYVTNDKSALDLVEADFNLLGATQGGASFGIDVSWRQIEIDGIKGNAKGARVKDEVVPSLEVNNLEFTVENLTKVISGSEYEDYPESDPTHDLIKRTCNIEAEDYIRWIMLVGRLAAQCSVGAEGEPIIFGVENVLQDGGFSFESTDGAESVVTATFSGHYDPSQSYTEPWRIWVPKGTGLAVLVTESELVAGMDDPNITVDLLHDIFDETEVEDAENWTLDDPDSTGLTLGSVDYVDDDTIVINMTGDDISEGTIELEATADTVEGDDAPESLFVEVQS